MTTQILTPMLPRLGDLPPEPCPEVLTPEEAARYIRLDMGGEWMRALQRYRTAGVLRGTQVGRRMVYRRVELDAFLERQTDGGDRV